MPTSPTPITALPTAPSRADPANFATRADSFLGALSTFRSEANALATNAYNNAVEADADATAAASSASAASSSASTATTKASEASASATAAQTSANTAAALLDAFDDRYLGSKASDPTVDNDGNPLLAGALYWSTTASLMKVYDGSAWGMAYVPSDFYLPRSGGTMTGPLTLSGGTANGVLYLNGSKVATSGSALTFDGTILGVGSGATAGYGSFQVRGGFAYVNEDGINTKQLYLRSNYGGSGPALQVGGTDPLLFVLNSAEQMRLTSTGLGIGTSSPGSKLGVNGNAIFSGGVGGSPFIAFSQDQAGGTPAYWQWSSSTGLSTFYTTNASSSNGSFKWMTGGSDKMFLDSSGNLGLGVTPSAWSPQKAMQIASYTALADNPQGGGGFGLSSNAYEYSSGAYKYLQSYYAALYRTYAGQHQWFTAPSGTAGNAISFTQALTLDANRNLLLNGTTAGASAVGTLAIFNGTAPTGSVTDGIILYAEDVSSSSELKVRDEAGNVTTLSPHNFSLIPEGPSEDMAWAYYSEKGGKRINVDMLKLARMVEKLTGEKLVYES